MGGIGGGELKFLNLDKSVLEPFKGVECPLLVGVGILDLKNGFGPSPDRIVAGKLATDNVEPSRLIIPTEVKESCKIP